MAIIAKENCYLGITITGDTFGAVLAGIQATGRPNARIVGRHNGFAPRRACVMDGNVDVVWLHDEAGQTLEAPAGAPDYYR